MAIRNKFRIKNLYINKKFLKSAPIVLENKFNSVIKLTKKYLADESNENLHQLRIAIRRLRYVMEIFVECYKEKELELAYKKIQNLQDKLGKERDLDIFIEKIEQYKDFSIQPLKENILNERKIFKQTIKKELIKFVEQKKEFNFLFNKK